MGAGEGEGGMSIIEVWIPGRPPTINHQYAHTSHGHYLTAEAQAWIEAATWETIKARVAYGHPTFAGDVRVLIEHSIKAQDVDACGKLVLDTVSKALGFNDKIVVEMVIRRIKGPPLGVRVRVWTEGE
jgi:hypothetical protein